MPYRTAMIMSPVDFLLHSQRSKPCFKHITEQKNSLRFHFTHCAASGARISWFSAAFSLGVHSPFTLPHKMCIRRVVCPCGADCLTKDALPASWQISGLFEGITGGRALHLSGMHKSRARYVLAAVVALGKQSCRCGSCSPSSDWPLPSLFAGSEATSTMCTRGAM